MTDAIEVRGLSKHYGGRPVVRRLDLTVPWGSTLAVFGPNGSGKTTLVKLLATLAQPTEGRITIGGLDVQRQGSAVRRHIGVVTHQPMLYDDLTPRENLRFSARMYRVRDQEGRIDAVARRLGIERYLDARVRTLSHGMQKRVGMARALLHQPRLLLLDEPETGLDQDALSVLAAVLDEHRASGGAALLTTHNVERGLAMSDTVAVLAGGRIAYQAPREAIDAALFRDVYERLTGTGL